jgi:hypothetical protein
MDSSAVGLKGHLTTKWDGKLGYNFVIEPDDPDRQAAFAITVSNPPRPASILIQIRNSYGVVLCTQDILLKFDPRKAGAMRQAVEERPGGERLGAKAAEAMEEEREAELDRKVAEETEREHGKNIFQVNAGANGKIQSISSQGEIPCPQSVYEGMGYWSFLPDFPTPEEQGNWVNRQSKVEEAAPLPPAPKPEARKRMPYKSSTLPGTFSIAGDDVMVEFDASTGSIETRAGKVFSIERTGAAAHAIEGYDLPVKIHYTCDQTAACMLTRGGAVMTRARLSR